MAKLITILMVCSMIFTMTEIVHSSIGEDPKEVEKWFENLSFKKQKLTKLHYYFHDTTQGKNQTAVKVAQSNSTFQSPYLFGLIMMMDDALTVGPEPSSEIVGRAQGFYGSADQHELGLLMAMNLVFTNGRFNGSSITLLGRNAAFHKIREMPIVGGSGVFRLARGIATAKTYSSDGMSAIVEYHVMVLHY